MKQPPDNRERAINLGPSKFSGEGFLGSDSRTVEEIVADDLRELERLGIEPEIVAHAMRDAFECARAAMGAEVPLREGVTAQFFESMGRIPSPFRGDGVFEKGEARVRQSDSGRTIRITRLGIALIEKHGFFQGTGAPYRTEPRDAVEILGLV